LLIFSEGPAARNRTNRSVDVAARVFPAPLKKIFTVAKPGPPPYFEKVKTRFQLFQGV
jgi:hypothetical protein